MRAETASLFLGIAIGLVLGVMITAWALAGPPADDQPQIIMQYTHART